MINNICGKTILLFCANFYGYDKVIRDNLFKLGAKEVILKDNITFNDDNRDPVSKKRKIFNRLIHPKKRKLWTQKLISEISGKKIDILFCVQYMPFCKWFIDYLRRKNPKLRTLLFLWDDIATFPNYIDYYGLFDKIYSFDQGDCINNPTFKYLPDFYLPNDYNKEYEQEYDVTFIGTLNMRGTKRINFLNQLDQFCKDNNLKSFLYLRYYPNQNHKRLIDYIFPNNELKKFNSLLNKSIHLDFMKTSNIPLEKVEEIQNKSKCLIDINYGSRCGYTLNVISAIAKGKKLITTNKNIINEKFYNPNNIYVVDIDNPQFSKSFFISDIKPIDISYLRIDNWLLEIFS